MNRFFSFLSLLLLPLTCPLEGWWEIPHRAMARLSYERLDPGVKEKVNSYSKAFALHFPDYPTFERAASFPDDLRTQGIGMTENWHYIDYPYDPTHFLSDNEKERISIFNECNSILPAIQQQIATIKNPKATPFAKGWAMIYLTHLTADLHQPLHTSMFYSKDFPKGDKGGNYFKMIADGRCTSLHKYWDSLCGLIPDKVSSFDDKERLIAQLKEDFLLAYPESGHEAMTSCLDPKIWAEESYCLSIEAREGVKENEAVSECYITWGQKISKERLALASYRLAHLLNTLLGSSGQ